MSDLKFMSRGAKIAPTSPDYLQMRNVVEGAVLFSKTTALNDNYFSRKSNCNGKLRSKSFEENLASGILKLRRLVSQQNMNHHYLTKLDYYHKLYKSSEHNQGCNIYLKLLSKVRFRHKEKSNNCKKANNYYNEQPENSSFNNIIVKKQMQHQQAIETHEKRYESSVEIDSYYSVKESIERRSQPLPKEMRSSELSRNEASKETQTTSKSENDNFTLPNNRSSKLRNLTSETTQSFQIDSIKHSDGSKNLTIESKLDQIVAKNGKDIFKCSDNQACSELLEIPLLLPEHYCIFKGRLYRILNTYDGSILFQSLLERFSKELQGLLLNEVSTKLIFNFRFTLNSKVSSKTFMLTTSVSSWSLGYTLMNN